MPRLLALHGDNGDASKLSEQLAPMTNALTSALGATFTFAVAPHARPGAPECVRRWYTDEWHQDASSLSTTLAAIDSVWRDSGHFDGLLGYSAGANLAAAIAAQPRRFPGLRFVILASPPYRPTPTDWAAPAEVAVPISVPTLHLLSPQDQKVPIAWSQNFLRDFFDAASSEAYTHPLGHRVPTRPPDLDVVISFVRRHADGDAAPCSLFSSASASASCEVNEPA